MTNNMDTFALDNFRLSDKKTCNKMKYIAPSDRFNMLFTLHEVNMVIM